MATTSRIETLNVSDKVNGQVVFYTNNYKKAEIGTKSLFA